MNHDPYQSETSRLKEYVKDVQIELDTSREERKKLHKQKRAWEAYKKLPYEVKMAFFCTGCQEDFVAPAYKTWNPIHGIGTWNSFCYNCESIVYRHVTDTKDDPYYEYSAKIRHMRSSYERDIIQPGQYGFGTLYGDPYERLYNQYQNKQEDIEQRYASMGLGGVDSDFEGEEEAATKEELEYIYAKD